jgi:hypothetical protein
MFFVTVLFKLNDIYENCKFTKTLKTVGLALLGTFTGYYIADKIDLQDSLVTNSEVIAEKTRENCVVLDQNDCFVQGQMYVSHESYIDGTTHLQDTRLVIMQHEYKNGLQAKLSLESAHSDVTEYLLTTVRCRAVGLKTDKTLRLTTVAYEDSS